MPPVCKIGLKNRLYERLLEHYMRTKYLLRHLFSSFISDSDLKLPRYTKSLSIRLNESLKTLQTLLVPGGEKVMLPVVLMRKPKRCLQIGNFSMSDIMFYNFNILISLVPSSRETVLLGSSAKMLKSTGTCSLEIVEKPKD